jgi:hypothetical protein
LIPQLLILSQRKCLYWTFHGRAVNWIQLCNLVMKLVLVSLLWDLKWDICLLNRNGILIIFHGSYIKLLLPRVLHLLSVNALDYFNKVSFSLR